MSTTVSYKGQTLATVSNDTKTLLTEGKYLEDDITLVDVSGGGAVLTTKNISANGTYNASSDSADGYSQVTVAVPNTYTAGDEGKVVSSGALVSQSSKNINSNGTHSTVTNNQVVVAVPNSYSQSDEGKVVSSGALVAQTAHADVTPTTSDQTIDTTTNNSIKVKGDADLLATNIKKDVEIFGVTGSYEGGGGGGNEVIQTTAINNSVGNVTFDMVLQALEDMNYTLTYTDCILKFRAKGANANSSPPSNYSFNNHTVLIKNGAIWNKNYNRNRYASAAQTPDGFSNFAAIETNNPFGDSEGMIDANHKIVNKFSTPFQGVGGTGTTVIMLEIPVDWSDFFTTL